MLGDGLGVAVGVVLGDGDGVGVGVLLGDGVGVGPTVFNGGVGDGVGVVLGDGDGPTVAIGDGAAPGPGGVSKVALVSATPAGRVPQPAAATVDAVAWWPARPWPGASPMTMPPASAASTTIAGKATARELLMAGTLAVVA